MDLFDPIVKLHPPTVTVLSSIIDPFQVQIWSILVTVGSFSLCQSPGRRNTLHNMMQYIKSVKSVSDRKCCPMMVIVATTPTVGCSIICLIQTLQLKAMIRVSVFKLLFARELADLGIGSWLFQLHVASHQCSHEVCYTVCCIKVWINTSSNWMSLRLKNAARSFVS